MGRFALRRVVHYAPALPLLVEGETPGRGFTARQADAIAKMWAVQLPGSEQFRRTHGDAATAVAARFLALVVCELGALNATLERLDAAALS